MVLFLELIRCIFLTGVPPDHFEKENLKRKFERERQMVVDRSRGHSQLLHAIAFRCVEKIAALIPVSIADDMQGLAFLCVEKKLCVISCHLVLGSGFKVCVLDSAGCAKAVDEASVLGILMAKIT